MQGTNSINPGSCSDSNLPALEPSSAVAGNQQNSSSGLEASADAPLDNSSATQPARSDVWRSIVFLFLVSTILSTPAWVPLTCGKFVQQYGQAPQRSSGFIAAANAAKPHRLTEAELQVKQADALVALGYLGSAQQALEAYVGAHPAAVEPRKRLIELYIKSGAPKRARDHSIMGFKTDCSLDERRQFWAMFRQSFSDR